MSARYFWLSFCDPDRPTGQQFLGVSIVAVELADAEHEKPRLDAMFPQHLSGAEWIAAVTAQAHLMGCNPGGEVASMEIPPPEPEVPLNRLLQRADLEALGLI